MIQVPSATWRVLDQATEIGYIHVTSFTERTEGEVMTALQELQEAGITGVILDLRGNYGGLLDPAVGTASQFLSDGVVLYELSQDGQERSFPVRSGGVATDVPDCRESGGSYLLYVIVELHMEYLDTLGAFDPPKGPCQFSSHARLRVGGRLLEYGYHLRSPGHAHNKDHVPYHVPS